MIYEIHIAYSLIQVKCDEARPTCLKCTNTGRKCDGYAEPPARKKKNHASNANSSRSPSPTRGLALSPFKASSSEMRALEYFCVRAAPSMGMYFDADFWNSFVVQASVAEPALTHVMVAVGVLAERRELLDLDSTAAAQTRPAANKHVAAMSARNTEHDHPVAIMNYNKSIGLLAKTSSPENIDMVLLAVILFVCVEFLRGDDDAALRHFKGGMAIITNIVNQAESSTVSRLTIDRINSTIMPFFNRLEMLYTLFGNDASWSYPVTLPTSIPTTFTSMGQARDSIVHLMNLSLRFVRSTSAIKYSPAPIASTSLNEQAALLNQIHLWHSRFSTYQVAHATQTTPSDVYAANVLEIQRLIAHTWVSVSLNPLESTHDAHIAAYTTAVSLAEQLSTIAATPSERARYSNTFILDMELVGPIHWVSIKCRDAAVRRRAIAVQRSTHRREGIWDSKMTAAVAERIMAAEEAGLEEGQLPSEEARVHHSIWRQDSGIGPSRNVVTLLTKPDGVYGDFFAWEELISLGEG
ncbi:hypothetical protein Q7P37_002861 [Cladosporium fusiforme]